MAARISEHRAAREQAAQERNQRRGDRAMVAADVARIEQQLPLAEQRLAAFEELGREDLVRASGWRKWKSAPSAYART